MANSAQNSQNWTSTQAYVLAVICLVVGVFIGYFIKGSASPASAPVAESQAPAGMGGGQMGPGQIQQIPQEQAAAAADSAVQPLLQQLKTDPNNASLLVQIGNVYYDHNVYKEAIDYYEKSLKINSSNPDVLTDLGTAYFYLGDSSTAIKEFNNALKVNPTHANALFNMGIVKWQGMKDPKGAIEAWDKLLKTNPNYEQKQKVQELIERAKAHGSMG